MKKKQNKKNLQRINRLPAFVYAYKLNLNGKSIYQSFKNTRFKIEQKKNENNDRMNKIQARKICMLYIHLSIIMKKQRHEYQLNHQIKISF